MTPSKVILVLIVGLVSTVLETSGTLRPRPFLRYLHRQGLKVLRGGDHHHPSYHHDDEHYHHFYLNNPSLYPGVQYGAPNPFLSLHPPTILPGGQIGHSQYSLYSPHIDGKLSYNNYWDLPNGSPHIWGSPHPF